jgi:hypothetical protein
VGRREKVQHQHSDNGKPVIRQQCWVKSSRNFRVLRSKQQHEEASQSRQTNRSRVEAGGAIRCSNAMLNYGDQTFSPSQAGDV